MRVVHWNTHHGGMPSKGPLNVQAITDWLIKFQPDVVSLNELELFDGYGHMDQLEAHRRGLQVAQGVEWYAAFCSMSGRAKLQGGGVALLSKWPLGNVARKQLSNTRPVLYAAQPWGSLFTLHPTSLSATARKVELAEALAWMKLFPSDRVLVCGDFNAVPTSSELAPWPKVYQDAWPAAKAKNAATSFTKDGITHGAHRIDYIWTRGLTIESIDVPDTRTHGIYPSDHHPVIAVVQDATAT